MLLYASIGQWIDRKFPKLQIWVRFQVEAPKSCLKLCPYRSVEGQGSSKALTEVRVLLGVQKYMGGLHAVLDKSDIVLTDTVLNQVNRLVPDCNSSHPPFTWQVERDMVACILQTCRRDIETLSGFLIDYYGK